MAKLHDGGAVVIECPACGAEITAAFEARGSHYDAWTHEYIVDVRIVKMVGCPHADGWRPNPDGDGGLPIRLPEAV